MKALGKLALLFLCFAAAPAVAQEQCRLPSLLTVSPCNSREEARGSKGDFDHYILSFSWSPAFCETPAGRRSPMQCRDNRFGWVVHGLWPQYAERRAKEHGGQRWPQYCGPVQPVPEAVLRRHLCSSPDPRLMQCEWAKHGSCSDFADPAGYFAAVDSLHARLVLPQPQPGQSPTAFASAVVAANRAAGLERRHVQAVGSKEGVRGLRVCFDRNLRGFTACGIK